MSREGGRGIATAMKPFLPAVVALVLGIVLGAWQPRGELLALRAEADALRAEAKKPCRGAAADRIRTILRAEAPVADVQEEEPPAPDAPEPEAPDVPDAPADGVDVRAEGGGPGQTPEDMQKSMHAALDARRAQALAALREQGGLDDAQVAEVDRITADMNAELEAEVERFVAEAVQAGEVDRRDLMDFAAESLDVVIAADDAMRGALPEDVYARVDDSALDPLSYLSGETLDSLARLEGVPGLE